LNKRQLAELLDRVESGNLAVPEAVEMLALGPFLSLGTEDATLDSHRALRQDLGEVVLGDTKTNSQLREICTRLSSGGESVLVTRLSVKASAKLARLFPGARVSKLGRTLVINPSTSEPPASPFVALVTAGTGDLPVAHEAQETCRYMGVATSLIPDVGVAGIHRLQKAMPEIRKAAATIVVAGMDAALPSVIAGLVRKTIIGVPTSVGYGAHFGGLAGLLAMLNSCAPGVLVCNIDNGFSAGVAAARIATGDAEKLGE
jgi:pyridinium-3,5-biscarboxylic acid mononucleotide synthase